MKRLCLILAFLFLFTQTSSALLLPTPKVVYRGTVTGLRISAVDGTAFIDNALITPELQNAKLLSSGSVTAANLKLSAVDGTAFVDFSAADVLTNNIGKYIVIKDSTGKEIKGWIKAAGTGETLTDLIAEWDLTSGWATFASTINDADTFTTAGAGGVRKDISGAAGALVKLTASYTTTASIVSLMNYGNSASYLFSFVTGGYRTLVDATGIYIRNAAAGQTDITSMSIEQVLTPSATGVTIVSSKGGTTYNWESKDASFAYNSAITYSIYDRDLTAYADGNHQIEIYDSSNRMLRGVLKAAGTGETLSETELVTNGTFALDENWDKDTGWTISDGTANASSIFGKQITQAHTYSTNILTKATLDISSISGGYIYEILGSSVSPAFTTTGSKTVYLTATSGTYHGWRGTLTSVIIDNYSLKQVLTPSALGATIVSAKGGTTYNFAYKDTSFTYNAASYYCIVSKVR